MENEKEETLNEDETSTNEELETQDEEEESNEEEETEESDDSPTMEDFEKAQAKLKELEEKNKQLYARLKKSEVKPNKPKDTEITEEQLLKVAKLASSLDDEDLDVLKTVVGNSIAEKVDNPLFKAYKAQKDKKKRSEASALRPSAPGNFTGKKNPNDPNLSKEEHRKLVEQLLK